MADGEYREALSAFEQGSAFARKADALANQMPNQGYILVSEMLISPEESGTTNVCENLKESFQSIDHGEDFFQQLDTAYNVFSR